MASWPPSRDEHPHSLLSFLWHHLMTWEHPWENGLHTWDRAQPMLGLSPCKIPRMDWANGRSLGVMTGLATGPPDPGILGESHHFLGPQFHYLFTGQENVMLTWNYVCESTCPRYWIQINTLKELILIKHVLTSHQAQCYQLARLLLQDCSS